jgi:hypothetical protein
MTKSEWRMTSDVLPMIRLRPVRQAQGFGGQANYQLPINNYDFIFRASLSVFISG